MLNRFKWHSLEVAQGLGHDSDVLAINKYGIVLNAGNFIPLSNVPSDAKVLCTVKYFKDNAVLKDNHYSVILDI